MPLHSLPREMINAIASNLSDKHDLCSVSLVSSHFSPSTRPLLFSTICLSALPNFGQDVLRRFVDFLSSASHICPLIRHFTLQRKGYPDVVMSLALHITPTLLGGLLAQLPNLESLSLFAVDFYRNPYEGESRFTIKQLVLTEAAQEIGIYGPLSLFESIDELTIISTCFSGRLILWEEHHKLSLESFEEMFTPNIAPYTAVNKLRMDSNCLHGGFLTEVLRRTRTLQTISSFHLLSDGLPLECPITHPVIDFLSAAGQTITHLTLATGDRRLIYHERIDRPLEEVEEEYASEEMCAKLSALTALDTVTLRLVHRGRSGPDVAEELPWFIALTSILTSLPTTVKRIELSFCNMMRRPNRDGRRFRLRSSPFWDHPDIDLRRLLPMLEDYKELEAVVFHKSDMFTDAEKSRIKNALHELDDKDLIQFESYVVDFFSVRDDLM